MFHEAQKYHAQKMWYIPLQVGAGQTWVAYQNAVQNGGDFYTLASCNPNGCGAPNQTRKEIGKLIDAGKTDRQIWDDLVKDRGPEMTLPHLRK
jgi:hypothetical protein